MIKYTHGPKHCILLASASDQEENVENQILDMQRMNSASPPSKDHQRVGGNNCTLLLQRATKQILLRLPHFTMVKCCTSRQLQQTWSLIACMEDTDSSLLTGVNSMAQMFTFEVKVVGCNTCNNNVCSNGYREHDIPKTKTAVYFNNE